MKKLLANMATSFGVVRAHVIANMRFIFGGIREVVILDVLMRRQPESSVPVITVKVDLGVGCSLDGGELIVKYHMELYRDGASFQVEDLRCAVAVAVTHADKHSAGASRLPTRQLVTS